MQYLKSNANRIRDCILIEINELSPTFSRPRGFATIGPNLCSENPRAWKRGFITRMFIIVLGVYIFSPFILPRGRGRFAVHRIVNYFGFEAIGILKMSTGHFLSSQAAFTPARTLAGASSALHVAVSLP